MSKSQIGVGFIDKREIYGQDMFICSNGSYIGVNSNFNCYNIFLSNTSFSITPSAKLSILTTKPSVNFDFLYLF